MKKMYLTSLLLLILLMPILSFGQIKDSAINVWQVEANYSFHIPEGDLADRFGVSSTIGMGLTYKTNKNWMFGVEANYIFGGNVKEDTILRAVQVYSGSVDNSYSIINRYGEYGDVLLSQRGAYFGIKFGKLFPVGSPNNNSGIVVNIGGGFLQHKIHIENKDNNTNPVLGEYKKGYDRLTNGLALKEFVGYQYLGNNSYVNFYVGVEFYQAWTKCRRVYNFDMMGKDNAERNDFLFGVRAGWILPLYKKAPGTYYYF
jgi:hypothetical protein